SAVWRADLGGLPSEDGAVRKTQGARGTRGARIRPRKDQVDMANRDSEEIRATIARLQRRDEDGRHEQEDDTERHWVEELLVEADGLTDAEVAAIRRSVSPDAPQSPEQRQRRASDVLRRARSGDM